ncbi:MAG: HAD family hydrolase [Pseudomonadota bacterium]
MPIETIAFDADDTLWHNERYFKLTQTHFEAQLAPYYQGDDLHARLTQAERRNLGHYGFGVKGFVLSMIETALEVTDNAVPGDVIAGLLEAGQQMLAYPIELLPGVQDTVTKLAEDKHLIIITKGDLLDQERKIAQSGLGDLFSQAHVVSDKTTHVYQRILSGCPGGASRTMMVGNSMKSDILPALDAGAWATFIPQDLAWDFEHADPPASGLRYKQITSMHDLPEVIDDSS